LRLACAKALDLAWNDEIFVATESNAVLGGEALGAFGYEIDVWTVAENLAGGANRISQTLDASYAAAPEGRTVHDEGVELNFTVAIQEGAAAGVEGLVIFEDDDCFFDRIQGRTATFEDAPSSSGGVAHTVEVRVDHIVGNGPGSAVYD
jgi:hypothetical protein